MPGKLATVEGISLVFFQQLIEELKRTLVHVVFASKFLALHSCVHCLPYHPTPARSTDSKRRAAKTSIWVCIFAVKIHQFQIQELSASEERFRVNTQNLIQKGRRGRGTFHCSITKYYSTTLNFKTHTKFWGFFSFLEGRLKNWLEQQGVVINIRGRGGKLDSFCCQNPRGLPIPSSSRWDSSCGGNSFHFFP